MARADDRIKQALGLAPADQLGPLLGNDLVVAKTKSGPLAVWVVKDEPGAAGDPELAGDPPPAHEAGRVGGL